MSRIVCAWLSDWAIDVWTRRHGSPPETGFALIDEGRQGPVIVTANDATRAAGIKPGMRLADARVLLPGLQIAHYDATHQLASFERLARWAERYAPAVSFEAVPQNDRLLIDISGAAHLHGGEARLLHDLQRRLAQAGVDTRIALADTIGAAWALARHSDHSITVIEPGGHAAALHDLPVDALRLDGEVLALLRHMRLRTIGQLMALPRDGLARRFTSESSAPLLTRLDQALGRQPEPINPCRPRPLHFVDHRCAEPLVNIEAIAALLPGLIASLTASLGHDGCGARHVTLAAFRTDHAVTELAVTLSSPTRDPLHIGRMLSVAGLERLDIAFGVDALRLSADSTERLPNVQPRLESDIVSDSDEAQARLIDRLRARLGPRAVRWSRPRASWLPERADRWQATPPGTLMKNLPVLGPRPVLLFEPPEPVERAMALLPDGAPRAFTWRRIQRRIVRAAGPERIAPEWWRDSGSRSRDYYIVEDDMARRYWLYRDGLFERAESPDETAKPRWFVHGLFG